MIRRIRRCVTAHDLEPMHAALVVLILAVGALSISTFKALDHAKGNASKIEAAQAQAREALQKLDDYQRLACRRGNVLRGYLLVRSALIVNAGGSADAAGRVFAITDCDGRGRRSLSAAEQRRYLDGIAARMGVLREWRRVAPR